MGSRETPLTMKGQLVIVVFLASAILLGCQAQTTGRPTCPEIECPNEKPEGGMFARGDCLAEFCDCSYGTPYLLKCEDPSFLTKPTRFAIGATTCATSVQATVEVSR